MKLADYLEKKKERSEQQKLLESKNRDSCHTCLRPKEACFCDMAKPFDTNIHFRLLMHPLEAKRGHIGTGRPTNHLLKNCEIIIGENFDHNQTLTKLLSDNSYYPMLLYPGKKSYNLSKKEFPKIDDAKTPLILVIDGTWPCAKSMMRDSKILHGLPRVSFESSIESKFAIKHQPDKFCLSTLESIQVVLESLEDMGLESLEENIKSLPSVLASIVKFQMECAKDPARKNHFHDVDKTRTYKPPSERERSKRWDHRKICFEEDNY